MHVVPLVLDPWLKKKLKSKSSKKKPAKEKKHKEMEQKEKKKDKKKKKKKKSKKRKHDFSDDDTDFEDDAIDKKMDKALEAAGLKSGGWNSTCKLCFLYVHAFYQLLVVGNHLIGRNSRQVILALQKVL